ncbi:MAG: hypothetical protein IPG70_04935 [Moraxellaceae bacterium]|nr:hypothetical protein [Moraxellaceae bacterium]
MAVWKHVLSNTGSVNDTYNLSLTQATNDNGDLLNPVIVEDTNGNGIYDPTIDTVISQVSLNINKQTTLFVVGTVPTNAKANDVFNTILKATSNNTKEVNAKIDSVVVNILKKGFDFDLTAAPDLVRASNQLGVWKHLLSNTGSLNDIYDLSLVNATNDNGDLINPRIFEDTNNNGQYDVGVDVPVTQLSLNVGQQSTLFVVGTVPANAQINDVLNTKIIVLAQISKLTKNQLDVVSVVKNLPALALTKTVATEGCTLQNNLPCVEFNPQNGTQKTVDVLTYTLSATNILDQTLEPIDIVLDGVATKKVVFRDDLPPNVRLLDLTLVKIN